LLGDLVPDDTWALFNGKPGPELAGQVFTARGERPEPPSAVCQRLFDGAIKRRKHWFRFVCAPAPSGEVWTSISWLELPPRSQNEASGHWQLAVQRSGKSLEGPVQTFVVYTQNSGEACQSDVSACLQSAHYSGLKSPLGFWFLALDADKTAEALILGSEEINNDRPSEFSYTLWRLTDDKLARVDLSERAAVFGALDCTGDKRPEFAINPYRRAGDDFRIEFGLHARVSSQSWSLLVEQDAKFQWVDSAALSRGYASTLCPRDPGNPFLARGVSWPAITHCAKLWGRAAPVLSKELEAACAQPKDAEASWACRTNRPALETMIRTPLPLVLTSTDRGKKPPAGCFDENME
jgi:hypothetical protein